MSPTIHAVDCGRECEPHMLAHDTVFAQSEPLLAKIDATYSLLSDVYRSELTYASDESPAHKPSDDLVLRRWLDDRLALARGLEPGNQHQLSFPLLRSLSSWRRAMTCVSGVWCATTVDLGDEWERAHNALFRAEMGTYDATLFLTSVSDDDLAILREAVSILKTTIPVVAQSTLSHTRAIYMVDGGASFLSGTTRRLPRVAYIHRSGWVDPITLAELLLHESVHQKMYDLQVVYTLYEHSYDLRRAPVIKPSWHSDSEQWPFDRAFAAAHVYVHLSHFYASLRGVFPERAERSLATVLFRARFLLDALSTHLDCLNARGRDMFVWLCRVCDVYADRG